LKEVIVGVNDAGMRLDRFIGKVFPSVPPSLVQKAIRKKDIKVNKKRCLRDLRISAGDVISLFLDDSLLSSPTPESAFLLINTPKLNIIYEDENILLLDKPAGQLCHSDESRTANTLLSHIQAYLYQKGEYNPDVESSFAPALCNRIDRNTGGIVIAAKNAEALRILNEKIKNRELEKRYLCLAHGKPQPPSGYMENYIMRDLKRKQVYVYDKPRPGAKTARTHYSVLQYKNGLSLVECILVTGRTHQIRAQMAHAGHPLYGDGKYGVLSGEHGGRSVQALYSYKLKFTFKTGAGILDYLNKKEFEVKSIPFVREFTGGGYSNSTNYC
jgi:23S rRNA pseudouridine955/2504/2580 synthase